MLQTKYIKSIVTFLLCLCSIGIEAQHQMGFPKFSPQQFNKSLEFFIAQQAHLTPKEAAAFFPVYHEMLDKQRTVYNSMRKRGMQKPIGERACLNAITEMDKCELELKLIQKKYHAKFLKILPASKVYDIIQAEFKFHRMIVKGKPMR